jgi:NAD(P)-dependent dehydrogenase (short-subunit alcohol dehydrogenase family)
MPEQIDAAAHHVTGACGDAGLAVLVNAAGRNVYAPLEYTSLEDVTGLFDVLAFGPLRLSNALLPGLKRFARRSGERAKILNVISWASLDAGPFVGAYAAGKAAALRFTQTQYFELERFGIAAVAVVPGLMKTPFITRVRAEVDATLARLPPVGHGDYGHSLGHLAFMSASASDNPLAADPGKVARQLFAIAQHPRPKYQYNLGLDTWLVTVMNTLLPLRALAWIKRSMFALKLPKEQGT